MEYNKIKNADKIISKSPYLIVNPTNYKNKWKELFGNNNPINIELIFGINNAIIIIINKISNGIFSFLFFITNKGIVINTIDCVPKYAQ